MQHLDLQNSSFADKNIFTLATMKNSRNNQLYSSVATKKHIGAERYIRQEWRSVLMVPVGVSKFDYTGFILLDPAVKTNEIR